MSGGNKNTELNTTFSLEEREYFRLSSFIVSQFGIKLPPSKKSLIQCRLQKRLKALRCKSFKEYTDLVFSGQGINEEIAHMIDAISTNKTDFFREPVHFDFLNGSGLNSYLGLTGKKRLAIWSAGCSSGEEPYSIGMILKEFSLKRNNFDFEILATDISESVLQHAIVGIYNYDKVKMIPLELRNKYLLKGKNDYKDKVRIIYELRNKTRFLKYNLISVDYSALGKFDIIFCRNVLIYFDHEVQCRILRQFCKVLNDGGYLFLGHSESIMGHSLPLIQIRPTIFQKEEG